MMSWPHRAVLFAALFASLPLPAQSLFRCTEADGKVTYSGKPCGEIGSKAVEQAIAVPLAPVRPPPRVSVAPKPAAKTSLVNTRRPLIRLFYDPANAPIEHSNAQMAGLIQRAAAAWSAGCALDLEYAGSAPYFAEGSPERVSIRWLDSLMTARHPAHDAVGIAGVGSMREGVSLRPRVADEHLPRIIRHEIGHVLGIGHLHDDKRSVMSYLPDGQWALSAQPSEADYLACNRAIHKRFGTSLVLPDEQPGRKMGDREAIERRLTAPVGQ
jgi:hypothetical protein